MLFFFSDRQERNSQLQPCGNRRVYFFGISILSPLCDHIYVFIALMDKAMYLQLVLFFLDWVKDVPEAERSSRLDLIEGSREAIRSILSVTGVHRLTAVLAEAWQIFTPFKVHGTRPECILSDPAPIGGAAPATVVSDLHLVAQIAHAPILEKEICTMVDWLDEVTSFAEMKNMPVITSWLVDLRMVVGQAHFSLVHREHEI